MWIIETKGWEDKDVPFKDARTIEWCKAVTELTGQMWDYIKVPYAVFINSRFITFESLVQTLRAEENKSLL
jgi:hypothetical protein